MTTVAVGSGDAGGSRRTPPAEAVWVRRCRSCGQDDLTASFGQPSMAAGPWSCAACPSQRSEPVRLELPAAAVARCPHRREPL